MIGQAESDGNRRNYPLLPASQLLSAFGDHFILMLGNNLGAKFG
jgi:hypothetical protein